MGKKQKRFERAKLKPRKIRSWLVVAARDRHTAGDHGDKRKAASRDECRKWKHQVKE